MPGTPQNIFGKEDRLSGSRQINGVLPLRKSVHFKKTAAQISILSKLWYFQYKSKQKLPQFGKNRDLRNCLLKMNGL